MTYRHVVLFTVRDGVPEADVDSAVEAMRSAYASAQGVTTAYVGRSLDTRKGTVVVEDLTFVDGAAYGRFRTSREHGRITALMAGMADWVVGDYVSGEARGDA